MTELEAAIKGAQKALSEHRLPDDMRPLYSAGACITALEKLLEALKNRST